MEIPPLGLEVDDERMNKIAQHLENDILRIGPESPPAVTAEEVAERAQQILTMFRNMFDEADTDSRQQSNSSRSTHLECLAAVHLTRTNSAA